MSHNHMQMSSAQHPIVLTSNSGPQPMQQRSMIAQIGSQASVAPAKAGYQMATNSITQFTQLQQPSQQQTNQLVSGYHTQKQDLSQFPNTISNNGLPTQNGTYQSSQSSLPTNPGFDSSQMGLQHPQYQHTPQQPKTLQSSLQPQHYAPPQTASHQQQGQQMQYCQQTYATTPHHHILQQKQQIQQQQQHHHHQSQQLPLQQQHQHQTLQHLQIQQHLQQRSLNQQQRYHKQQISQPKQILQNDSLEKSLPVILKNPSSHQPNTQNNITNCQLDGDSNDKEEETENNETLLDEDDVDTNTESNASEKLCMANTKEKTPMCLINELARFNKMTHQYTLVDEQGPAHKKTFYVKLKVGDEEYSASGESIKKAQHAAAAIALEKTKYKHPPPKPARMEPEELAKEDGNITPTVELNALAMKRGEATSYKSIEPQQPPYYHQPSMDFRGMYNQRYHQYMRVGRDPRYRGNGMMWPVRCHYSGMNRAFYVSLRVGHREFIGDGPTRQAARHNAAQKALRILKNVPISIEAKKAEEEAENDDSLKSEISLVHEIALRRNMSVQFEVTRETGPPHMKNFVTSCTVSHLITEGEGNSKKTSKKKAAEQMLEELRKLPPAPAQVCSRPKVKMQMNKKKNRNLIKSELQQQKADPNYGVGINPISRLIQIMQAQKKKEPVYTLAAERGLPRRREFVVQVEVEEKTSTGTGPNIKLAKRGAAEAMLQQLGYTKPSPQPTKSSFKNSSTESGQPNGDRKVVTFVEGNQENGEDQPTTTTPTHQRVPGLIHLPSKSSVALSGNVSSPPSTLQKESLVNLANILKPNLRPEIQLRELCKAMGYQLEIDDFTKKRLTGTEHITRITVGSENAQSFHGSNTSLESSRDMAALDALKVILGKFKDIHPGGDCPQVKKDFLIRTSPAAVKKDSSR